MRPNFSSLKFSAVLRGEVREIHAGLERHGWDTALAHAGIIALGAGAFGAAIGWWRSDLQALYTAVKLPLVLLLTTLLNAVLNAMLAPLLGLNLNFRQCLLAILTSFSIAGTVLGAFSPLAWFLVWNVPPLTEVNRTSALTHSCILLLVVAAIALAGITANLRLAQFLRHAGGNRAAALRVLFAWLAGNLLLGSQLSWIMRPFIGSPGLPVQFLRLDAFHSSFFEAWLYAVSQLFRN